MVSAPSLSFSSLGETAQLTAAVHDQNGQAIVGATVAWVSADPSVATVDGNGLVSAAGNGATNITVTAGTTASASVAVTVEQVANAIVLSAPPDSLAVGDSIQMTAEALDALDNAIGDVALQWSSSDPAIATVDQEGWVRGRAGGSVEITVAAGTTASATATVMSVQVPSTIVLSAPAYSVAVGDSIQITAEVLDGLGNAITDVTLQWSSVDSKVVTVDQEGWVRARAAGSAEITVAAGTTATATATVTAVQVPNTIMLSAPADSVAVGDSIQMTAEAFDGLGNPIANVTFEWSSSNTTAANVDQRGWVRAQAEGSAVISVTLGNLSASRSLVIYRDQDDSDERAALEAFYHATNGPGWKNNTNWLTNKPLGEWYGVTTDAAGRVITLHLHQNGLRGRLPAELAQLKNLRNLLLWGEWERGLSGPIPPELGRLANLTNLDLGNNELTGPIPPELGDLANLTDLSLTQNKLTGPIPPELGHLTNLERLYLGTNRLTGEVPPEIGNLTGLTRLSLHNNDLTGPIPALGRLSNLVHLSLSDNRLTGEIPPEMGNLGKLEWLSISGTDLTGPIPPELGRLPQLRWLWLSGNSLTGSVPAELGSLHNLELLDLADNNLNGPISPELGALPRLTYLGLSGNPLTAATIPPELGKLTQLKTLALHQTGIRGPIPPELGNLASLESLWLGGDMTGRIPPELGNLGALQTLFIWAHSLRGPIPPELGKLAKLESLRIFSEGISGSIPPELGNLGKLKTLHFSRTGLTGAIPPELGKLTGLTSLTLNHTRLSGMIPPQLGHLAGLRQLWIHENDLEGRVPDTFLNLRLDEFRWHDNTLCLPDTHAFRAWRGQIQTAVGPYCAAGAAAVSDRPWRYR